MSRPAAQSLQSRWCEWSRSLCCCRGGEAHSVNGMGGRLSRKKRGYNVNDPKEGKTTAESPQDPEVKDDLENPDASKEQVKKPEVELPEEKPETEAPKAASDAAKPADLATPDVKTEEKATVVPATDPVLVSDVQASVPATDPVQALDVQASVPATDPVQALDVQASVPATDPVLVLDVQASVPATDPVLVLDVPATDPVQASGVSAINLVKATEQSPEPVEHHLVTETVEFSSTPDTGSSADTPDVPELSEGKTQTVLAVCEETQAKPVLDKEMGMTSEHPSNETSSLGDHVATEIMKVEQLENSHLIPEDQDESEVPEVIENQDNVSPQSTLKEVESALQETSSESGVEVPPKEIEIPRLPITVETPIDIVLKNEIASCEKHVAGPDTRDEIQEKMVSETIHPTDQMVADVKIEPTEHSVKNSDHVQDSSVQEDSDKVLADQSLAEGSGNLSVDTLRGTSVTDVVPAQSKDAMAECPPEMVSTSVSAAEVVTAESTPETKSNTVTETRCEQTPELISHQDSVKTPPLETSSEAIPDIKVTVYTEGLQEQIETGTEPTKASTGDESLPESFVSDSEAHPPKLDSTVEDSTVPGTASALTFGEPSPTDVIKTEETSSMKTENGFSVDEQSQNEGDKLPDASVVNGTPVDNGDQSKKSQVEVNSQSETIKAEENIQGSISDSAVGSKSIEQVNTNPPAMESGCVKLDNQTLDSEL
ncbi:uncharacterized protein LOC144492461 [Mustelus asterias]